MSLAVAAAAALVLALSAGVLKRSAWLPSAPLAATALGILVGPAMLGLVRPDAWGVPHHILLEIARMSVATAVMSIALRVPWTFWKEHAGAMALALSLGMLLMWLATAALCWLLLPLGFASALLLGAVLTPTDPVISGAITTGQLAKTMTPEHVRYGLAAESGANDGAAYAFVTLPLLALLAPGAPAWDRYLTEGLLRGIVAACVAGAAVGAAVAGLQRLAVKGRWPSDASATVISPALALLTLGVLKLLGSDGILGVFVAGVAFNAITAGGSDPERKQEQAQERVQEILDLMLSWPAFLLFGAMLPWHAWRAHGWMLLLASVSVLLLRRPPWFYFLSRSLTEDRPSRLFLAWFGPIGMAAIFYAAHAYTAGHREIWIFGSFLILASVVVHGITATAGTKWYGRRIGRMAPAT